MLKRHLSSIIATALVVTTISLVGPAQASAETSGGNALAWGDSDPQNDTFEGSFLGDNFFGQIDVPASLANKTISQVSAGRYNSGVIDSAGKVTVWGSAGNNGSSTPPAFLDSQVVKQLSVGYSYFLAVTNDGSIVDWGHSNMVIPPALKNLVDGVAVGGSKVVDAVDTTHDHSLALSGGDVYAWGSNTYGQTSVPADLGANGAKTVAKIAAGNYFSMALDSDGKVHVWGNLNVGSPNYDLSVPSSVDAVTITDIAAGGEGGLMALDSSGRVHTWGYFPPAIPADLADKSVTAIAVGGSPYNLVAMYGAVTSTGETYLWGPDGTPDIGPGHESASNAAYVPPNVSAAHVTSISLSGQHQLAVVQPKVVQSGSATLSGLPMIGQTLTATAPAYTPVDATPTYQWLVGGNPISGATGPKHYVSLGEGGKNISVRVTGAKAGFTSAESTSAETNAVSRSRSVTSFTVARNSGRKATFTIHVSAAGVPKAQSRRPCRDLSRQDQADEGRDSFRARRLRALEVPQAAEGQAVLPRGVPRNADWRSAEWHCREVRQDQVSIRSSR